MRSAELDEESDFRDSFLRAVAQVDLRRPSRALRPGERLGGPDGRRFEIREGLGEGAMGLVLRARDDELQRVVALKFLFPREELAGVGLREARAIAQLDHENIVRIFDVSEWRSGPGEPAVPVLVMECLEGESLAALLRRERPLGQRRALEIIRAIAAGLAHAHAHHVVHRDLKPSNVFLCKQGAVKLLDFGLAWHATSGSSPGPHLPTAGTPPYMAPEQWRGGPVDERADLWAAGVVLYEMLTGELPYPARTMEELRAKVLSPEPVPPLRGRHPELPRELESLVSAMLAKAPEQRLRSAAELCEELRELEEHLGAGPEAPRAAAAQRRQVTLVSCRVAGLAALAEEMDPEDFGELEAGFHRAGSRVIQRHGGFLTLCMGDELLACFGYPAVKEGDAERAVLAGLQLPQAVHETLLKRLPPGPPPQLAVQVGICTGMVVLDGVLPELRGTTPAIHGEAPRVAAWLSRQAGPDQVVLGPSTQGLVRRAFDTEPLGPRRFDGRTLTVHQVLRARPAGVRFERALAGDGKLSSLVGRERELQLLLDAWRRAREGRGGCVLLSGEAGIGKSRLIQELFERALPDQPVHLRVQCWSQFSTSALHPIIEGLQRRWFVPGRSPQEHLEMLERRLTRLGLTPMHRRLIASLLSLPVPDDSLHLGFTPQRLKEETVAALATLLMRHTGERPVLMIVEDLHWVDPSTFQLLDFLLGCLENSSVLFVLSARPDFRPPWTGRPGFQVIALEGLPAACSEQLVKEVARGQRLPDEVVKQLVARTEGVPLFVEEMTRAVLEGGAEASIPVTLQELLLARLDALPPRQKQLAQLCGVVGHSFTPALLAALTGLEDSALRRDLAGLLSAGLLQAEGEDEAEPGYQFRHPLIQEVAYESLPRRARRQYHQRIARALEERFPEVVETRPELLARHYTEAGEARPAIRFWKRAGERAGLRSAHEEAISHLTQALKLLRSLPEAASLAKDELQLLMALGGPLVQVQGYGSPEVERTYMRVWQLLREVGEVGEELPRQELSYWGLFSYLYTRGKLQDAHEVGELLVSLGERHGNRELLSLAHRMMATTFVTWGEMALALRHVELALESSDFNLEQHRALAVRQMVNPRAAAFAFGSLALSVLGRAGEADLFAREARELGGRIGHAQTMGFVLTYCAFGRQVLWDAPAVLAVTEESVPLAREHRFRLYHLWNSAFRSWALAELGHPEEGLVLMRQVLDQWKLSGILAPMHHNLAMLASIHLRLGQAEEGLAAVDQAFHLPLQRKDCSYCLPELLRLRGELLRLVGREDEARQEFQEAIRFAREHQMLAYEQRAEASLRRQPGAESHTHPAT